ncbi:Cellulose synthase catalytic subunit [UDP-forming] [Romboutsia ilealis]|uniref:cellulose synthase (UDP-forming) n=1 Tax=Romboutsia ilealis TaxID=1115758 RepID=A0A1V1I049_9FIRM|nr:glycosyltransferase [Romboutsia ilealis]CED93608.1 Cellulose synthase catalytic subunit [UDP-forming] [Romboutsia ilealis]
MYALIMVITLLLSYIVSKQKVEYRKILIFINAVVCCIYIIWRITVIPIHSGIISFLLGITLFLAEALGLISFLNFKYLFTKKYKLELKTLDDFQYGNIPYVDVLICTYNEPLYLLEKTIAASTNLDYPTHKFKIHVCDDGRRDSLKLLCKKYNVNYISRDNNEGAKAGNINNALKYLKGDLFAVLDADMIPKKEFLSRTVGYFTNENLAFVQVPQVYYNKDTYQYNLMKNIPNEQDFFMRDIQEARASINAVLHVGTNALFKREYVNEIGGYPTCSITEDMAVGMLLQSRGYDSVFINEELVLGLSATTFTELVKQRDRWCRGNIQVLKHFNPIFTKGLTLPQKIAYFDGGVYWFSNLQKIVFILFPIIYLLTRKLIIDSSILTLLNMYIPFILGQILIFNTLSPGNRKLTWAHFYEIAMAPHLTLSILKEMLFLKTKFNVTLKEIQQDKKQFQFRVALPHIVIVIVTIIAWIVSTRLLIEKNIHVQAYLLNMIWSIYNFIGAIICIKVSYQKPIFRTSERININEDITVECDYKQNKFKAKILNLSEKGIGLKLNEELDLQCEETIKLDLKGSIFICKISRINKDLLGLSFNKVTPYQMKLIMSIFTENMQPYYKIAKSQEYIVNKKEVAEVAMVS